MTTKLLLADDSATIQRVIGLTFAGEDVQVIVAGDGEEAINRISLERPDIVLADIGMPKRSGYEVSAFVKSHPDLRHVPVVLLAGAFDPVDDVRAREAGCDRVLVKPFEPRDVIATVRELVERAGNRSSRARPVSAPREESFGGADVVDLASRVQVSDGIDDGVILDAALDDYFDKIDRTFSGSVEVDLAAASTPVRDVKDAAEDRPVGPTLDDLLSNMPDAPVTLPELPEFDLKVAASSPLAAAPAPMTPSVVSMHAEPDRQTAPVGPKRNVVAHAFSALLAAEQGEPWDAPPALGPSSAPPVVTNEMVDEVARRVVERLSAGNSDQVSKMVRQVVSEIAERLVREEIDRIRSSSTAGSRQ